jgi:hypothetical protein
MVDYVSLPTSPSQVGAAFDEKARSKRVGTVVVVVFTVVLILGSAAAVVGFSFWPGVAKEAVELTIVDDATVEPAVSLEGWKTTKEEDVLRNYRWGAEAHPSLLAVVEQLNEVRLIPCSPLPQHAPTAFSSLRTTGQLENGCCRRALLPLEGRQLGMLQQECSAELKIAIWH